MLSHWLPPLTAAQCHWFLRQDPKRRNTTTVLGVFSWFLIPVLACSVHQRAGPALAHCFSPPLLRSERVCGLGKGEREAF